MSLDVDGFSELVNGGLVSIVEEPGHRLIKLAQNLPWEELLELVLPDLQCTDKKHWWMGRSLQVRIQLGVFILQQMLSERKKISQTTLKIWLWSFSRFREKVPDRADEGRLNFNGQAHLL